METRPERDVTREGPDWGGTGLETGATGDGRDWGGTQLGNDPTGEGPDRDGAWGSTHLLLALIRLATSAHSGTMPFLVLFTTNATALAATSLSPIALARSVVSPTASRQDLSEL